MLTIEEERDTRDASAFQSTPHSTATYTCAADTRAREKKNDVAFSAMKRTDLFFCLSVWRKAIFVVAAAREKTGNY